VGRAAPGWTAGQSSAVYAAEGGTFDLTGGRKEGSNGKANFGSFIDAGEFIRLEIVLMLLEVSSDG
jgi:hypothetical protein